jgi:adenine-specific DNA-methyltransferase
LQLLEYLYPKQVDCIYIDPPYNTGARDWKYNNDYVDSADAWRHSKWLSMMQKRLKIAKRILNPKNSVLIVTIDEKEYLHLGCLLEEMFPEARIQMVSTMINPAVVARAGEFGRSGEYIFFVLFGNAAPLRVKLDREWVSSKGRTHTGNIRWDLLKRSGTGATRKDSPGGFYPIYINPENGKIEKIGDPLPNGVSDPLVIDGLYCLLPIRNDGSEGRWQWSKSSLIEGLNEGRVKTGGDKKRGFTVYRLAKAEYAKVTNGEFNVIARGINNEIIVDDIDTEQVMVIPGDIWKIASHDSTQYGSRLLGNIFTNKRFTFPKSLYAVKDCLYFFTADNPNALIVDFFAGSGTTLHAVNLINAEDGGQRRCIMVTNNEVSADESKSLTTLGYQPGDPEWEKLGIAQYVTWPRTVCSIEGHDINGNPLKGNYLGSKCLMSDGFQANCEYFKLGFLDKNDVAMGKQFKEILPLLWLKAGAVGNRPELVETEIPDMLILPENRFAVLVNECSFMDFEEKLDEHQEIETVFIVTDSERAYREMISGIKAKDTYQLYRDYLDNFRINARR